MGDALGAGWLTQLIIALPVLAASLYTFGKWVASRWQKRDRTLEADKEALGTALEAKSLELIEAMKEKATLEIRLDSCIGELRYWRSGKEPPEDARFGR